MDAEAAVKQFLNNNTLSPGVICGSYDITVGTINAMDSSTTYNLFL